MNEKNHKIMESIKGKLIVSCQALSDEPLHSSYIMSRMAYAAMLGGAAGIRANSVEDIKKIKETVNLPVIGIIKKVYSDSEVYITPTIEEVDALVECGADIIAIDATKRCRPGGRTLKDLWQEIHEKYQSQLFMADCSTVEEGMAAAELGFNMIGTTLSGYTDYTKNCGLPNIEMMKILSEQCQKPVIGEGGIWTEEDLIRVARSNVWSIVIGSSITRPMLITKRYVGILENEYLKQRS